MLCSVSGRGTVAMLVIFRCALSFEVSSCLTEGYSAFVAGMCSTACPNSNVFRSRLRDKEVPVY